MSGMRANPSARFGWVFLSVVLAACAGSIETAPPPSIAVRPAGMQASDAVLTVDALSFDASDPASLAERLDQWGFLTGLERTLTGADRTLPRAFVRALRFSSAASADSYQQWLRDHQDEYLGTGATTVAADVPAHVSLVVREPSGCCHREVPIYFAHWRHGATVWSVRVSGPRVRLEPVVELVRTIEEGG